MSSPKPKPNNYARVASTALVMIAAACDMIDDKDQRGDVVESAGRMLWYAARASAFAVMEDRCTKMLKDNNYPEETVAIAEAAIHNMDKLNEIALRCQALAELFKDYDKEASHEQD
jgi:hypothetical protein